MIKLLPATVLRIPKCLTLLLIVLLFSPILLMSQGSWTQKANFGGGARVSATAFSIGTKGYLGTGGNFTGVQKDFWEFDPSTNIWTQKAQLGGVTRAAAVGFAIGSNGYLGLGQDAASAKYSDFWEYNPGTNQWTQKADFGGGERGAAVGFAIGNKGYVGTGQNANGYANDFWAYDPGTNQWTQKANFGGFARAGATGFAIGANGYIGLGLDDANVGADFWEYNPTTNQWTQKEDFGGGELNTAVGFAIGSKGYIGTGLDANSAKHNDFWEFDPVANQWTQKANFGGSVRNAAAGFAIGNFGYLGTGYGILPFDDFWEFSPIAITITTGTVSGSPFCAGSPVSVPFTITGQYNQGNVFTVQLSNADGEFTNPVSIGTLTGTASGTVNAVIPSNTVAGTEYRIRVVSSSPQITGSNNGTNLTVNAKPSPAIVGPSTVCASTTNSFYIQDSSNSSNSTLLWSVSGGTIIGSNSGNSVVIHWGNVTSGNVSLRQTYNTGGCSDSTIKNMTIFKFNQISISGVTDVCAYSQGIYYVPQEAGVTYHWTASGGTITGSSTTDSINVNWGDAGSGSLSLVRTAINAGCTDTVALNIQIHAIPQPAIDGSNSVARNRPQTYSSNTPPQVSNQWYATGGTISGSSTDPTVTVIWGNPGQGSLKLVQTSVFDCKDSTTMQITINNTKLNIYGSTIVCQNSVNAYYTDHLQGRKNNWTATLGTIVGSATGDTVNIRWITGGVGSVELKQEDDTSGNQTDVKIDVNIKTTPVASFSGHARVCPQTIHYYTTPRNTEATNLWTVSGGSI
ncbi:MAG: kelch repeat-containing protein, partial [Bacteroidota bacterium]